MNLITMELGYEQDVVLCRQRVRQVAELVGFERQDQTRIATAVSEIARNAFEYAGGGRVEIGLVEAPEAMLLVTVRDAGPGVPDLGLILEGRYVSRTGLGVGILGAKRLMEHFEIESQPGGGGTRVTLGKPVPRNQSPITPRRLGEISGELARKGPQSPFQEVQAQNQELLRALDELQLRQAELARLNRELEETNRGVVALYAELDEKAASLRRASEAKTAFLSHMTHEFRTPLNSIIGLARAALSGDDGALLPEHRKQVTYIQKSAQNLSELVNDLLDIAKVEAGKVEVRPSEFDVAELLGGLRGVLKPLATLREGVNLVFTEECFMSVHTDEGKLAQILRNLVANALKYTERGEVRVDAEAIEGAGPLDRRVRFTVTDTGIGIAPADQDRIFDEFVQIESPLQKGVAGTGLGLPLSRRLAELLGGTLTVRSEPGRGSCFSLEIPATFVPAGIPPAVPAQGLRIKLGTKLLVIDDEEVSRYLLKELLPAEGVALLEAVDGFEGVRLAVEAQPDAIFLDLQMPAMSGFYVLDLLKANARTCHIPVVIHTAMTLSPEERARLDRHAVAIVPKSSPSREIAKGWVRDALALALRKESPHADHASG